ncbi:MAG TPA: GGDEF domain-containing protein [Armatimonadetes bacterium]|jgi:diguanylate cyclase|nr:GGDEF domain-containing protein [Armatimonadota bacterium]
MMGWWNRKRESSPPAEEASIAVSLDAPSEALSEGLNAALDTLGVLLQEYGRNGFDTDEMTARQLHTRCEQWARHLLTGGPKPGEEAAKQGLPLHLRDWRGVCQFFVAHRREESRYINRSSVDLRQSLWTLIQVLDATVAHDEEADQLVQAELEQLKRAAESDSAENIRRAVISAVSAIGRIALERRLQQREQMKGLHSRLRELGEQLEVARQESALDPLTGLYNRRAFDDRLAQALTMNRVFGQSACLLMIDLDHFKQVNDTYGHVAGDEVLRSVADCLTRTCRVKNDFVARYGGEEFAVILWNTSLKRGVVSAERLLDSIRGMRVAYETHTIAVTASIGIAEVLSGDTATRWVERADRALYDAKTSGRNCICEAPSPF